MVNSLPHLPPGFLECNAREIHEILPEPSLIHLPGKSPEQVFVSILLHGNEDTGLRALQALLSQHPQPVRGLMIFVGNPQAAAQGQRRLPQQPDFNRIWAGGDLPEHQLARDLLDYVARQDTVAAIDIHNNTGRNPLYACINHIDRRFIQLARSFSETIVFFSEPHQVIANNLARFCPAVTLECGRPGDPLGIERARQTLEYCLFETALFESDGTVEDTDVFHTVAKMTLPNHASIHFGDENEEADFCFRQNLDEWNFRWLERDVLVGRYAQGKPLAIHVTDDAGHDISDDYFRYENGEIRTRRRFIPSMLTLDEHIIHQDCLGYIMEHYPLNAESIRRPKGDA